MKREILFRGRCIETMKWIYGFVHIVNGRAYIKSGKHNQRFGCGIKVDPETVGQFTGLLDKNGVKIFEGDVVRIKSLFSSPHNERAAITFHTNSWCVDMSSFYPKCREGWVERITNNMTLGIVGNIHDKEIKK